MRPFPFLDEVLMALPEYWLLVITEFVPWWSTFLRVFSYCGAECSFQLGIKLEKLHSLFWTFSFNITFTCSLLLRYTIFGFFFFNYWCIGGEFFFIKLDIFLPFYSWAFSFIFSLFVCWHCHVKFSVLTPYYTEEVLFSLHDLEEPNEDGVSILFYLQKIYPGLIFILFCFCVVILIRLLLYPCSIFLDEQIVCISLDEWKNFLERVKCTSEEELKGVSELEEELRLWASYRGQTLTKTGTPSLLLSDALHFNFLYEMLFCI